MRVLQSRIKDGLSCHWSAIRHKETLAAYLLESIILSSVSRLPPAEPATADPGTDCATANPHVTNTLSVSPGDFVWNF